MTLTPALLDNVLAFAAFFGIQLMQQQHEESAARHGGADDGERMLTLPRDDGGELRIEWRIPTDGPPIVSLRVWARADAEPQPARARASRSAAPSSRP